MIVPQRGHLVRAASPPSWRQAMKAAVRDPTRLCEMLQLPPECHPPAQAAARLFGVFAPLEYLARIPPGDPSDPLLRQILPIGEEFIDPPGFSGDPLREEEASFAPGVLRKYTSRALLVTTGACAVHCRYCFRRHFPYEAGPRSPEDWRPTLVRIAEDSQIDEVILSGGDPLTLVDSHLDDLVQQLARIDHVRRLRVHTRLPIMIPQRVNDELLTWLRGTRLTPIMVVHANHPRELDDATLSALGRLVDAGIPTLNQAVLLRGVNDDTDVLAELCQRLVDCRVMPYYLHQLDRVTGAAHFEVPIEQGRQIMRELRARLPGYAVPRYVQERPGELSKTPLE